MGVTKDDYINLLAAFLPPGPAWSIKDPSIAGTVPSLLAVHKRADALMLELDPRTTTELIGRWETIAGLPDECVPVGVQTLRQRQQRLDAKLNLAGGINPDFYLGQLEAIGVIGATITQYDQSVGGADWRYYWQVNMPYEVQITDMTCMDNCMSAIRWWGDTIAECILEKLCPSHTYVVFNYPTTS